MARGKPKAAENTKPLLALAQAAQPAPRRKRNDPDAKRDPDRDTFFGRIHGWWNNSDTFERTYLLAAPVVIVLTFLQGAGYLGVPRLARAFIFAAVCIYLGFWFVVLLNIDRRVETMAGRRSRGSMKRAQDAVSMRMGDRREAARVAETVEQRAAEARRRGQIKAGLIPPDPDDA